MNKKLIIAAIFLTMGLEGFSQLTYGPKAGLNIAWISFSSEEFKTSIKPGFFLGGFTNYKLADKMALQGELVLSMEGTKEERTQTETKGNITKLYLHLPVLFQYEVSRQIYVEAGPQIGLLLSSKEKYGNNTANIKKYYNSTDIRFPIGAGYTFGNKLQNLRANIRYSFSLSKVNNVEVGGGKLKNQVISIGAQYTL